jgi:LacI family transcriptional regulator
MLNGTSSRFTTSILPDEYEGGRTAVRLLHEAGVRERVALVGYNRVAEQGLFRSETVARRIAGIRAAMEDYGLSFIAEESCWEWEPHHGYELTRKILRQHKDLAGLLCLNDRLAFGAYQALAESGRAVPGDVSIVSFDNDEIAGYLRPGLTTIGLPHEAMGKAAVRLLLSAEDAGEHLVAMPVIERASIRRS